MSLVNQVLKDLQQRQAVAVDTEGLIAAGSAPSPRRASPRWLMLAAAAVVVGVSLVTVERLWLRAAPPLPAAVETVAATPAPVPAPVPAAEEVVETSTSLLDEVRDEPVTEVAADQPEPPQVVDPAPEPAREAPVHRTLVTETPRQRGADAYSQGVRALAEGRRASAESHFRSALSHDAALHDARLALANLLASDGRLREAEIQLQEGLRIAPRHADFAERYARLLFDRNDLAGAIGVLESAQPPVAADPDYHALLAALLQRAGNHDAAADTYAALVGVQPDHGLWWMGLGLSLEGAGRPGAALDAYTRAARDVRLTQDVARFVRERIDTLDDRRNQ